MEMRGGLRKEVANFRCMVSMGLPGGGREVTKFNGSL